MVRKALCAIIGYFARQCPKYRLALTFADGSRRNFYAGDAAPDLHLVFKTVRAEWRSLVLFYQGLIEAYIDEEVDILGDQPMMKIIEIGDAVMENPVGKRRWTGSLLRTNPIVWVKQVMQEARQQNRDLAQAKQNAIDHYGHASEFFEQLLGYTVGYSEGYWPPGTETLNQAKHNFYDYIARKLRLEPGHAVVEVGSGWGYLPLLMAKQYGADVTVYNPVPSQNVYMHERFKRHGLEQAIPILEKDHRELKDEPNAYDRYVSIGIYEHAGKDNLRDWIESIAVSLKPGGLGLISTTAKMRREMTDYLTLKYVFPGGHVPSLPQTLAIMRDCGLTVLDVENLWPHYQRTCRCWLDSLEREWSKIRKIDPSVFNERFRRIWTMYLSGTSTTFSANLELVHILFMKGRSEQAYSWDRAPIYRDFRVKNESEIDFFR
jgi:cyclopropane-fatty-acyl-phospholipid synthase